MFFKLVRRYVEEGATPMQAFVGHAAPVLELAFASKGRRVVSVGEGDAVYVWGVDEVAAGALTDAILHDHVTFSEGEEEIPDDDDDDDDDDDGGENEGRSARAFAPRHTLANTPSKSGGGGGGSGGESGGGGGKSPAKSVLKSPGKYSGSTTRAAAPAAAGSPKARKKLVVKSPMKQQQQHNQSSSLLGNGNNGNAATPLHAWAAPPVEPFLAPLSPLDDDATVAAAASAQMPIPEARGPSQFTHHHD